MLDTVVMTHMENLRAAAAPDPRPVHDALRRIIGEIESNRGRVPAEMRALADEFEAEIAELHYDNLPI
ncbi:MAG: hypothetical protein KDA73_00815 [Rhodobacteraceae bacterium]|nr:hypothetical protein [Paracoccaceae bacterium]